MVFIETPTFTRLIATLLDDDEYSELQEELAKRPDSGDLVKNGGGPQVSVETGGDGQEKRHTGNLLLVFRRRPDYSVTYPKNVKDDLTAKETAILRKLVKEL